MATSIRTVPDYLTCHDFAAAAGVTSGRIRQLLSDGTITGLKISKGRGAAWLIARSELRKIRRKSGLVGRPRRG